MPHAIVASIFKRMYGLPITAHGLPHESAGQVQAVGSLLNQKLSELDKYFRNGRLDALLLQKVD
jgi:hypothetical protein